MYCYYLYDYYPNEIMGVVGATWAEVPEAEAARGGVQK